MPATALSPHEARRKLQQPTKLDLELIEDIAAFYADPLGFILYAFPWGEPGTPLEKETGPDSWQVDICNAIRERLEAGLDADEALAEAIQIAVASGHGIGKTAFIAWIILWFMSTRDFPQVVVTANTSAQLQTKTWRELAKWHKLAINREWFVWSATKFAHVLYPEVWFAAAIPWTETNSEAFAGTHEKHVLVVFDEGSAIADKIWEVSEGAMTTPGAMWIVFGNPTQNTGRFAQCFGKFKHRWITRQVDSRTAKMANKAHIQKWIDDYGEDHDFVRVRVRGMFPRSGDVQFIGLDLVSAAMKRKAEGYEQFAKVLGVDVARHGSDQSVITRRQANHVWPMQRYRERDLMRLADIVAGHIHEFKPDAVFVDATGMGWGVIDRLRQLGFGSIVIPVQVGEKATDEGRYVRKRDELWGVGKKWLEEGGCLPADPELEVDLTAPQYGYDPRMRIEIESKDDMKARGLSSPDSADSLLLTFASPIAPRTKHPPSTWRDRLGISRNRKGSAQAA
jgi:hypothetical protein